MSSIQKVIPLASANREVSPEQRVALLLESLEQQKEHRMKRFAIILGAATLFLLLNALSIIYLA